jgi:hypothetical protein
MTPLEKYKAEVDSLIDRLDNMSFGFTDEAAAMKLMADASQKLQEMMLIITNIGIANGSMASALQIMTDK